jgi:hypothetical protein
MSERLQILQMLQDGAITADEAYKLLQAIEPSQSDPQRAPVLDTGKSPEADLSSVEPSFAAPTPAHLARFRRLSQVPFAIAIFALAMSGWGLYALDRQGDARITLGWVALLIVLVLSIVAAAATFWMMRSPWLHVRIWQSSGKRIAVSLPLPLTLAGWSIRWARRFVGEDAATHLDAAAGLLRIMRDDQSEKDAQPIVIDVDEKDERVQVYIG